MSLKVAIALSLPCLMAACASGPATIGRADLDSPTSQAHGAAYRVDAMTVRRPMPSRPDWRPVEFYYKHCSLIGEESYYSKTSYECSEPF